MTDPATLKDQVATLTGKTIASQLRVLMPDIERRIQEGVEHETIVEGLTKAGLPITLNTFRVYLYRYRSKTQAPTIEPLAQIEPPQSEPNTDRNTGTDPEPIMDGNPDSENPSPEPEPVPATPPKLADILDAKKGDALTDQYMTNRKPLIGRKRSDNQ